MLCERDTFGINGSFGAPQKKFNINLRKTNLSLHYNGDNSYLFVNEKNTIDKSDILNTHKYLMVKNNIK